MGKGRLLIVDDEPLLLKSLQLNLEDTAEQIILAKDGLEALEILTKETIHCVVCDIKMPRMDGVELIKRIRETGSKVPFIFYTGHGNNDLMMKALKYGAFDFLDKPNLEGVEEIVGRALKIGKGECSGKHDSLTVYLSDYQKLLRQLEEEKD